MNLKEKILSILKDACQAEYDGKKQNRLIQPATPRVYGLSLGDIVSKLDNQVSINDIHSILNELIDEGTLIYHQDTKYYTYHNINVL